MPLGRWRSFQIASVERRRKDQAGNLKFGPPELAVETTPG
jgi:hypothetical protein